MPDTPKDGGHGPSFRAWQPIESGPKDGTAVWLFWRHSGEDKVGTGRWSSRVSAWSIDHVAPGEPSHWMMPAPPNVSGLIRYADEPEIANAE